MSARLWAALAAATLLSSLAAGCRLDGNRGGVKPEPPTPTERRAPLGRGQSLGAPLVHENLAVYPVHSAVTAEVADYLTLDEALEKGLIQVTEKDEAEVNVVFVTSFADRPIYLMAGEVILGGKQDRVVGKDTIIPPHAKRYPVNVFCVEPHRWEGQTGAFKESRLQASSAVRKAAQLRGDQALVWEEVARANAQAGVAPRSGAYRASARDGRPATAAQSYVDALAPKLKAQPDVVGMVVAIDGRVVGADVYASPSLFRKLQGKLLAAHARDAVETSRPGRPAAPPPRAAASQFLRNARQGEQVTRDRQGAAETEQVAAPGAVGFRTAAPAKAGPAAAAPPVIHENYYRNTEPPAHTPSR